MREIATDLARWLAAGEQVALATVVWAEGSSPRPPGARLALTASGHMAGSVSGGCVEGAVCTEAQEVLSSGQPKRLRYSAADESGWEVGLACGGSIEVYVEPLAEVHRRVLAAVQAEETVALATRLGGSATPPEANARPSETRFSGHLLAWPDGRLEGDSSLAPLLTPLFPGPAADLHQDPEGDVFLEVITPPPTLVIVGAVHIAVPLVTLAQALGFHVRLIDARRAFATRERFPTVDELVVAWPQDALQAEKLGPQHAVAVLSHDPKFDVPALQIALRSRASYVGLIGSRTTQAKRRAALREAGFSEAEVARIHGPVGLDLGGREPAEIALAILAEVVAVRHGRSGGTLSDKGKDAGGAVST
jgi:xanthine dehydrogenase accessory factor